MSESEGDNPNQGDAMPDIVTTIQAHIDNIQATRNSKVLVLFSFSPLDESVALSLNNVLRRMGNMEKLDVVLESMGGDLDSAYKMLLLLKSYAKTVTVIVPFYAKSAAALIALGADQLQLCRAGELGPLDPQILDTTSDQMVPSFSIKKMVDFIIDVGNPLVQVSLVDKLSPLLIGAYRVSEETSKQYLREIFMSKELNNEKIDALIPVFTEKLLSHGYPITEKFLEMHGVPIVKLDESEEAAFADIHANLITYYRNAMKSRKDMHLVLLTNDMVSIDIDGTNITFPSYDVPLIMQDSSSTQQEQAPES